MGLTITNYPLLGGIASVDTSYANIRDIKSTKREDGVHELSFMYYISKDGISVHIGVYKKHLKHLLHKIHGKSLTRISRNISQPKA